MITPTIGFIGGGRVTRILLQAFANKKINLVKATVFDINKEATDRLKNQFHDIHIGTLEEAASREMVIIALHPPAIMETLDTIGPFIGQNTVVGSLAPKINSAMILSKLPQIKRLVRMIPNATSIINEGYNPIWFSPEFPTDEKELIFKMLDFLGTTHEVEEHELEAYAVISAMAPTYFWFQWKKLAELGESFGLSGRAANEAVLQSMYGALETYYNAGMSPAEVMDLIPVKPIGEKEKTIEEIYDEYLISLYNKLSGR